MVKSNRNSIDGGGGRAERRRNSVFKEISEWLQRGTQEKLGKENFRQIFQDEVLKQNFFCNFANRT